MTDEAYWQRLGFDSRASYMTYFRRLQGFDEPAPKTEATVEVAGGAIADIGAPRREEPRPRQVNVKLRIAEGHALDEAAGIYGLAPSTLARLLVNRGVEAILDREC